MLDTDRKYLKVYILKHFNKIPFFRSETLAKDILADYCDLSYADLYYDDVVKNWTKKISKILKEMETKGKLYIYSETNRGNLYKKVRQDKEKNNMEVKKDEL